MTKTKTQMVIPTPERFLKGDVGITTRGVYRSDFPTALELWRDKGYLGSGDVETLRFSACEIILELGEHTKLMASSTIDYGKVPGSTPGGEPDVSQLDHIKYILRQCSGRTSKLFFELINAPSYSNPTYVPSEIRHCCDDLVEAIEKWKKSDLFLQDY